MSRAEQIAAVLAEHAPACSGPSHAPFNTHRCGPIYCAGCSAAAHDWVTWTPAHVAAALDAALAAQEGERGGAAWEYRVNMTEDRDSWQDSWFIPCDTLERAVQLCDRARTWPNGKPRRWPEGRPCGPWERVEADRIGDQS